MLLPRLQTRDIGTWQRPNRVRRNGLKEEESGGELIGRCRGRLRRNQRCFEVGKGGFSGRVELEGEGQLGGREKEVRGQLGGRRGIVSPLNLGNGVFQVGLGGIVLFLVCLKREESETRMPSSSS